GLAGRPAAGAAAGAILHYARSTQKGKLAHIDRIGYYDRQQCLVLDAVTVRNLELIEPLFAASAGVVNGNEATLLGALEAAESPARGSIVSLTSCATWRATGGAPLPPWRSASGSAPASPR